MCTDYHPLSSNDTAAADGFGFTRRRLLGAGLTMVSTAATIPGFIGSAGTALADTTMRVSSKAGVPEDRVLVVVQLSGGNDGLNTVIPFGQSAYRRGRTSLAVPNRDVLELPGHDGLGLHPQLRPVFDLMEQGRAAVVQGVGYPNPNRSHFVSMDIWHTASPETQGRTGRGWIGQALDDAPITDGMGCIAMGPEAPLATYGEHTRAVSFESPQMFRWTGRDLHGSMSAAYDAVLDTPVDHEANARSAANDPLAFVHRTALNARVASDRIRRAVKKRTNKSFPGSGLGRQLETVAKMIRAELPTRVYYVNLGGFDTHAGQQNAHPNLLRQFAQAIGAFQEELENTGHAQRVVTLAFSEFGRRVKQNASGGTDHGVAGPVFLFGENIRPGVWGEHPSLTDLDNGDLKHAIDFRSVYADLLGNWMKLDDGAALGRKFRPTGLIRESA